MLRTRATSLLEVAGFAVIAGGFWTLSPAAGLIATGIALVLIGWLAA